MARRCLRRAGAIFLFLFVCVPFAQAGTLKIIAGTSLIEDVLRDLTDGRAEITTMLPGSSCPGHEDVKTTDFVFAARADLAFVHSFQRSMPQLAGVLDAVRNKKLHLVVVEPKGSWLIPGVQKQAVLEIAKALADAAPDAARAIAARAEARLARVDEASAEASLRLGPLKGKPVAVSDMQAEFVTWAGLDVVQRYKRGEELTAKDLAQMVDALRGRDLAGVIDNYQSGSEAGLPLAMELKVPHVLLSNFPGSSDDVPDYFSLLRHNVAQLLRMGR
jgi:zinc transport system substrate-binding protein